MARRESILTTRGQSFLSAGVVLLAAGLLIGLGDLTRLGLLLVGIALAAVLVGRRSPSWLQARRTVSPDVLTVGEHATVDLALTNVDRRRSPLVVAQEQLAYVLGDRPRFVLPGIAGGQVRHVSYTVRPTARGRYRLGPLLVRVRDAFGLTSRLAQVPSDDAILVLPVVVDLGDTRLTSAGSGAEGTVPQMVALHGAENMSIREYRLGDDQRRIHWPATAHRGEPMVRQEERPALRRAVVLLDSRRSTLGPDGSEAFEWAVSAVASVVAHLDRRGFAVHLVTDDTLDDCATATTTDAALEVLALARVGDDETYPEVVRAAADLASLGGVVVAVVGAGDRVDDRVVDRAGDKDRGAVASSGAAADGSDAAVLAAARHPGTTSAALVLDPAAFGHDGSRSRHRPGRRDNTGPSRHDGGDLSATVQVLRAHGWRTVVVQGSENVDQAWAALDHPDGGRR